MGNIIKFDIVRHDKIWGNEQWIISAHPNGKSTSNYGDNITLDELYKQEKYLFGNSNLEQFPLLVKIIEADDNLSVQVHPADDYAKKYENSLGKTECWYVLDAQEDADIVVGHNVENQEELRSLIETNQLENKLNILPIKTGDFFYIPAGTIHAIRGGTKILEVQQSSDITYRLYDYGRLENGLPRELHVEKSIDVTDFKSYQNSNSTFVENEQMKCTTYIDSELFTVEKIDVIKPIDYLNKFDFIVGVALNDNCIINGELLEKNQGFIIPNKENVIIEANASLYISYIR